MLVGGLSFHEQALVGVSVLTDLIMLQSKRVGYQILVLHMIFVSGWFNYDI